MHARLLATGLALLLLAGCASVPNPLAGQPAPTPASAAASVSAPGSATSADPRVATLIGAGVAPLTGAAATTYMDQEEADLRAQLQSGGVAVMRVGDQIVLTLPSALTFEADKAQVKPPLGAALATIGQLLKKYNRTLVDVYGYTDSQGSDAHDKDLSQRRAVAVAAVLANQGVDQRRFYVEGRGEADPVASNDNEVGRAQNRRVEIQLSPIG